VLAVSGCFIVEEAVLDSLTGRSTDTTTTDTDTSTTTTPSSSTQQQSSTTAAPATGAEWNQLMIMQSQMAFAYAFSAGGLWAGQAEYKPGEYTKFEWSSEGDDSVIIERAFLQKLDDGNEWWRVSWQVQDETWMWEALIDIQAEQVLRMRARDPDGSEGEVPVSEDTAVYMPPTQSLTKESVQGATVGKEKVDTPAGTFQADHVVYRAATGAGQVEFWLAPQVPGGVVKYLFSESTGGDAVWTSVLTEFGKKAISVLGSF
jgi:hypothetical protein